MKTNKAIILLMLTLIIISGCESGMPQNQPTQQYESKFAEQNQKRLIQTVTPPTLTDSLERQNIKKRLELLNDNQKIFYVYLINYGKVMAFHVAQGKISNLDSYMMSTEQIVRNEECRKELDGPNSDCYFITESPDLDGSYGTNGEGIFFFTTEGAYVEWKGDYMVSDHPLKISSPPELVANIKI